MAGLLTRALHRIGLAPAGELSALSAQVEALQTQVIQSRRKEFASGVPFSYGQFLYELNTALRGDKKWETLTKMSVDPHIKGALRFNVLPLLAADWDVVPGGDTARDEDMADFVRANLLRVATDKYGPEYFVQTSWRQRLYEILDMLESGFAMFAKSDKRVGARRCYDRLQWLEPSSVDPRGWQIEGSDEIVEIQRTYKGPTGRFVFLDPLRAAQVSLYVWELKGARYEGQSFMRSMFGAWLRKDSILRWGAMWAQKVGSPAPVGSYPQEWDQATISRFEDFVQSLRGTAPAEAYFVGPVSTDGRKAEAHYAGSEAGEVDRMRSLINGENAEIAHGGGTKSMLLGETATGSRALGESISSAEYLFLQAVAETVCDYANHGVANLKGEVQELVDWNYRGVKVYPRLVCSKIHPDWALRGIKEIIEATNAGILPKSHPEFRKQFALRVGFELPDEAFEEPEPVPAPLPARVPEQDEGEPEAEPKDEDDTDEMAAEARIRDLLEPAEGAPKMGRRPPNQIESRYVELAVVDNTMRVGERDLLVTLRDVHWRMIDELMNRLRNGKIDRRNLESQRRSKFRGTESAVEQVDRVLTGVSLTGAKHAALELRRQREGA